MSISTLLFSGTDLRTLCDTEDLADFWSSSDARGDLPTYPGINGATPLRRPVSSKLCSGKVTTFTAANLAATEDAVAAVKSLLRVNQVQTITRRKITGAGNLDATQTAIVRTVAERLVSPLACTLLIGVELCDGLWYGPSVAIAVAAGTQSVLGDTSTTKMTITLAAGSAGTITNTTNGYAFTFAATVPAGGVAVDVEARTAIALTGGADYSGYLSWTKNYPMQLEQGSNTLTVSAGSASIDYKPAYL